MNSQHFAKPFYIFLITLPYGISLGFVTVALPYQLIQNGFSVAQTAGIVAIATSASMFRFLWAPIVDTWLTFKKWYVISLLTCVITLLLLSVTPFTIKGATLLTLLVFASQLAGNFMISPISGFLAHSIEESKKGIASGFFQGGILAGIGLGGGLGLWLLTHYNSLLTGAVLCSSSLLFGLVVAFIKDFNPAKESKFLVVLSEIGIDLIKMVKVPVVLFVLIIMLLPIGICASSNLWSAIAQDWKTDADTVALITGILSGLFSLVGCIVGGYVKDKWGVWVAYFGSGLICASAALIMAFLPFVPAVFIGGVLAYAFCYGLANAAFTALILYAIGKKNAVTKYSIFSSIGNIPVVGMTVFNGWMHDKYNSKFMLIWEAIIGILCIFLFLLILKRMFSKKLIPSIID